MCEKLKHSRGRAVSDTAFKSPLLEHFYLNISLKLTDMYFELATENQQKNADFKEINFCTEALSGTWGVLHYKIFTVRFQRPQHSKYWLRRGWNITFRHLDIFY